jgi:hypothetical protein
MLLKNASRVIFLLLFMFYGKAYSANILGQHETANPVSTTGWGCVWNTSQQIHVHFWSDAGEFLGGTIAQQYRGAPWAWFCGNNSYIKFEMNFPTNFNDGKSRLVYAYAIAPDQTVKLLDGSPKRVNFPTSNKTTSIVFDQKSNIVDYYNVNSLLVATERGCSDFCISVNHLPYTANTPTTLYSVYANLGATTGFTPYVNAASEFGIYQKGPTASPSGTAIQAQGAEIGIYLNGADKQPDPTTANANIAAIKKFSPVQPYSTGTGELVVNFEAKIQSSQSDYTNDGDNNVAAMGFSYGALRFQRKEDYNLSDADPTKRWFFYGLNIYEPRPYSVNTIEEIVIDQITGKKIVSSKFMPGTTYGHLGNGSSNFSTSTWPNTYRFFEWRISRIEFEKILTDIKNGITDPTKKAAWSTNPNDYSVYHFDVGAEISQPTYRSTKAKIGMSVRNIQIRVER